MTPGYLLMPGRLPLRRCETCGVTVAALNHVHICVEPERGPILRLHWTEGREVSEP